MKTLVIVRHAKSSWENPGATDFDRPLNKRGKRNAPFMANQFAFKKIKIDKIYSSPAKRAITTCLEFAKEIKYPIDKISKQELIYYKSSREIAEMISKTDDSADTVMIFGHNPDFTYLATSFSNEYFANVPTCGVVCIDFEIDHWQDILNTDGKLRFFEYPKMFKH